MVSNQPYGYGDTTPTDYGFGYCISTQSGLSYSGSFTSVSNIEAETKEQKVLRIAREKMYASWKMYNQKTEKIPKIIQVCKPRHRLSFMGRRHLN